MNEAMLKEITEVCSKYPIKPGETYFLMKYNSETELFTGTPIYGALFENGYDIREGM